jgi:hypothetical protein
MSIVHLPATNIITDREQKFHDQQKLFFWTVGHRNLPYLGRGRGVNPPTADKASVAPTSRQQKGRRKPAFFRIRAKLLSQ